MNTKRHSAGPTSIPDAERWGSVHWSAPEDSLGSVSASTFKFTFKFTVIEQNEREIDAALKRSAALRQSILKKAFTGQLVPQDPTDEPASALLKRIRKERETKPAKAKKKRSDRSDQSVRSD
jgi:hypothetical protein